jgi:hypothetical protein
MKLGATSIGLQATNLGPLNVGSTYLVYYLFTKIVCVEAILVHFAVYMDMEYHDIRVFTGRFKTQSFGAHKKLWVGNSSVLILLRLSVDPQR